MLGSNQFKLIRFYKRHREIIDGVMEIVNYVEDASKDREMNKDERAKVQSFFLKMFWKLTKNPVAGA